MLSNAWTLISFIAIIAMIVGNAFLVSVVGSQNATNIVFSVELVKMAVSCFMVFKTKENIEINGEALKQFMLLLVPGIIYTINNNLVFYVVPVVGVVSFHVLEQTKLLMTGLLTVVVLRRPLSSMQWVALTVLTCAVTVHSVSDEFSLSVPLGGLFWTFVIIFLSSFSGVFTEMCYKSDSGGVQSVWMKNSQLYFHGVWINLLLKLVMDGAFPSISLFNSQDPLLAVTMLNQVGLGLSVGYLLKFHSSLVKNYIGSIALTTVSVLGVFVGKEPMKFSLLISVVLIFCSLYLRNHKCAVQDPEEVSVHKTKSENP